MICSSIVLHSYMYCINCTIQIHTFIQIKKNSILLPFKSKFKTQYIYSACTYSMQSTPPRKSPCYADVHITTNNCAHSSFPQLTLARLCEPPNLFSFLPSTFTKLCLWIIHTKTKIKKETEEERKRRAKTGELVHSSFLTQFSLKKNLINPRPKVGKKFDILLFWKRGYCTGFKSNAMHTRRVCMYDELDKMISIYLHM